MRNFNLTIETRSFIKRLTTGVIIINLLAYALVGLFLYQVRFQYERQAERSTQNLSQSLEINITGIFDKIDLMILNLVDEAEMHLASGGIKPRSINAFIVRQRGHLPEIDSMRMVTAEGIIAYGSPALTSPLKTIADRDYFIELRDNPKAGLVISKPVQSRITGKWIVIAARRVNQPNGTFAGIALCTLSLEYFNSLFSSLHVGEHGSVTMRDRDLAIVVRFPETQGIGSNVGMTNVSRLFRELVESGQESKTYKATYPVDSIERTYTYQKLSKYPYYINVGLAERDYLALWRKEAAVALSLLALLSMLTILAAMMIFKNRKIGRGLILHASMDGFCLTDIRGRLLEVNDKFCQMTGYSNQELLAMSIPGLEAVETADDIAVRIQRIMTRGEYHFESRHRRKDGAIIDVDVSMLYRPLEGGRIVAFVRDITERKKAEARLKSVLGEQKAILDNIGVGVLFSIYRKIIWANKSIAGMFGYTIEELVTKDAAIFYPDKKSYERIGHESNAAIERGVPVSDEIQLKRKDGSLFWCHMVAQAVTPHMPEDGLIWVLDDVTERKQSEQEREQLIENLTKAMAEIKTLQGILPTCSVCHKIRDDKGAWKQIETFILEQTEVEFTHGYCPECAQKAMEEIKQFKARHSGELNK